jgi:hypothetical protein
MRATLPWPTKNPRLRSPKKKEWSPVRARRKLDATSGLVADEMPAGGISAGNRTARIVCAWVGDVLLPSSLASHRLRGPDQVVVAISSLQYEGLDRAFRVAAKTMVVPRVCPSQRSQ